MTAKELLLALEEVVSHASLELSTVERFAVFSAGDVLIRRLSVLVTAALQKDATRHYLAKAVQEVSETVDRLTLLEVPATQRYRDCHSARRALQTLMLNVHMLEPYA